MQHLSSQRLQLSLATSDIMEVTLTPAVTRSYDAACKLLDNVAAVAADATTLEKSLFAVSEESNCDVESLYWIQNLTDSSVQFWVQRPGQVLPRLLFQPLDLGEYPARNPCVGYYLQILRQAERMCIDKGEQYTGTSYVNRLCKRPWHVMRRPIATAWQLHPEKKCKHLVPGSAQQ